MTLSRARHSLRTSLFPTPPQHNGPVILSTTLTKHACCPLLLSRDELAQRCQGQEATIQRLTAAVDGLTKDKESQAEQIQSLLAKVCVLGERVCWGGCCTCLPMCAICKSLCP